MIDDERLNKLERLPELISPGEAPGGWNMRKRAAFQEMRDAMPELVEEIRRLRAVEGESEIIENLRESCKILQEECETRRENLHVMLGRLLNEERKVAELRAWQGEAAKTLEDLAYRYLEPALGYHCRSCGAHIESEHKPDCKLAALLAQAQKENPK